MKFSKITTLFLIINILGISIIIFLLVTSKRDKDIEKIISRDQTGDFKLTSPILDCENVEQSENLSISYQKIKEGVEKLQKNYLVDQTSVYYRDLNNGQWVGINEKDFFSPASLMKTPLLIAFLKNVERDNTLLKKEVVATQEYFDYAIEQNIQPETKIKKGESYTLEEVASIMIKDSDNVATLMLSKYIQQKDFDNLFKAVGVDLQNEGIDADIRVKDFASIFRILYNASYLNRQMSEIALSILSQSSFQDGIVAGVKPGTIVAHKFGERTLKDIQTGKIVQRQLHDCGIVYSKNPYILCIMTQGADFNEQAQLIASITKLFSNLVK